MEYLDPKLTLAYLTKSDAIQERINSFQNFSNFEFNEWVKTHIVRPYYPQFVDKPYSIQLDAVTNTLTIISNDN